MSRGKRKKDKQRSQNTTRKNQRLSNTNSIKNWECQVMCVYILTIFHLSHCQFGWWRKQEKTTDLPQVTCKLFTFTLYEVHLATGRYKLQISREDRHWMHYKVYVKAHSIYSRVDDGPVTVSFQLDIILIYYIIYYIVLLCFMTSFCSII